MLNTSTDVMARRYRFPIGSIWVNGYLLDSTNSSLSHARRFPSCRTRSGIQPRLRVGSKELDSGFRWNDDSDGAVEELKLDSYSSQSHYEVESSKYPYLGLIS